MEETQNQNLNNEQILHSLINTVEGLKKSVLDIQNNAILENLKLPEDTLKALGVITDTPNRLKRGKGWRPLLESEILDAQSKFDSAQDCAKYLNVHYKTYKKWAQKHNIFKTMPRGKGTKRKFWDAEKGKYPLSQLLEGKFPDYPVHRLKDLLIRSGKKKAECENCGFNERRITDNKMPLILNFEDGNDKNHVFENIRLLCYNCTFTCGKGYIRRGKVEFNFNDPDRIQGASQKIESRF